MMIAHIKLSNYKCPKCNSKRVKRIIYGLTQVSLWQFLLPRDWVSGGCCVYHDSPVWHCAKCKYEWGNYNDELEKNNEEEQQNEVPLL